MEEMVRPDCLDKPNEEKMRHLLEFVADTNDRAACLSEAFDRAGKEMFIMNSQTQLYTHPRTSSFDHNAHMHTTTHSRLQSQTDTSIVKTYYHKSHDYSALFIVGLFINSYSASHDNWCTVTLDTG